MNVPIYFSRVLVVSGSSVFRDLLRLILDPHSGEVVVAADRQGGRDELARHSPLDVVICDVSLSSGDSFGLLDDVTALGDARLQVILVAGSGAERGCGGGLGVCFLDYGDSAMEALQAFVTEGGADTY